MSDSSLSSTSTTLERRSSFNTKNVLIREGIMPVQANPFGLTNYRPRTNSNHRYRDQDKSSDMISEKRLANPSRRSSLSISYTNDVDNWDMNFLEKSDWISLGDGWYQTSIIGSGSTEKYGLHSMIESTGGRLFMAVYEPMTRECLQACVSMNPSYNLYVEAKTISLTSTQKAMWVISSVRDGDEYIITETVDMNIKSNLFYNILLQIRDNLLSVDINGIAVFTSVRFTDGNSLNGILGVQAKGTKFALKGWKLKGIDNAAALASESTVSPPPVPIERPIATNNAPKSLAELMKEKDKITQVKSLSTVFERISDDPVPSWGDTGGPGRPQPPDRRASLSLSTKSMAPTFNRNKRNSVQVVSNSSSSTNTSPSSMIKETGRGMMTPVSPTKKPILDGTDTVSRANESMSAVDVKAAEAMKRLYLRHEKGIVDSVFRDAIQKDLGVTFDDIAALSTAKRLLNEAVILPLVMPEFFTGIREPWKGVLLFGPPGTGKTLLAKAVCSFSGSTFFNCSAASLISKYRGESEKIVRCLFDAARVCAPSVVFIDEVDALVSSRGADGEHEASRRMKTEIFSQMDGIASHGKHAISGTLPGGESNEVQVSGQGVMVLATTNCPWDLDEALRRRLEKRIYISLPDEAARSDIFKICLSKIAVNDDVDSSKLAALTDGYSGADIHIICREASMMPLRRLMSDMSPQEIQQRRFLGLLDVPKLLWDDLLIAIANTRPSVSPSSISRFLAWEQEFGSK